MSELKLYEVSEKYISYISTVEKMFFPQKRMTELQKKENNPAIGYLKSMVDFTLLEQMHDKFIEGKNNFTIL